MEGWQWIADNWFNILSAIGIISGFLFTAISLRSDTKSRKIANLLTMTSNHREIWMEFFEHPELDRVLDSSANPSERPVTPGEREFVNMVFLHVSSVYESLKDDLVNKQEGLRQDVGSFFSLPVPRAVWEKTKIYQNDDFVAFVESCRKRNQPI